MHRAPLRLNLLLEATAAWGRTASFEALLRELPRVKWILEFDRAGLLVAGTPHAPARAFLVTPTSAQEVDFEALAADDRAQLARVLDRGQPELLEERALAHPLESGSRRLGAIVFRAAQPYDHTDLRFGQFIVQALAGVIDRLIAREDELRIGASEERYRTLVSVLTDVPWSTNAAGAFVTPQPAWAAYTGQTWEEMRGFGWADALHPDDRVELLAAWHAARDQGVLFESHGRLRHAPSGTYRHVLARATPLRNPDDTVREWVGTCTDDHDRRVAEEALRESELRLREADARKDQFIATLAHELRNPLAPIRTGLQLIRLTGDVPEPVERIRAMMERQVGHIVRLIDDLLDVSRITSGRIHLKPRPTVLADVVHGAVEANRAAIDAGGIRLRVAMPDEICVFEADQTRLVQVLSNLLHNAAKFTPPGGRIDVRVAIADRGSAALRELTLAVSDSGAGIPAETLPRVFDLFIQGDASPHVQAGLGIGLALTKQLVELHGGSIEARSAGAGEGSEFIVRLPIVPAVLDEGDAALEEPVPVRRRVVVIDDNEDAASTLAMLVERLGSEARTAGDGLSGLRCVLEFRPDLVFVDIGMPGIDGYETCRRIRQRAVPAPVLVALTGWGQDRDRQSAFDAGFDAHLTKPAEAGALIRLLADTPRKLSR